MSNADTLRTAADEMNRRAMAALEENDWRRGIAKLGRRTPKGRHMATWNPAVAREVATLLAMAADHAAGRGSACGSCAGQTLRLAQAYLDGARDAR